MLKDPITINATVKGFKFDEDGECLLTLRIPATDALKASRFAIMRQIVFSAVFTPVDVENQEQSV